MRSSYIICCCSLFVFLSCSSKKSTTFDKDYSDTTRMIFEEVTYETKNVSKSYEGCSHGSDSCTYISITYDLMKTGGNKNLINTVILDSLTRTIYSDNEKAPVSIEESMNMFINDYKKRREEGFPQQWTFETVGKGAYNTTKILSYGISSSYYTGGAHPNGYVVFYNFNLRKGNPVTLKDLLRPGFEEALNSMIDKNFRKEYQLKPGESLKDWGLFEDKIEYTENVEVTDKGLTFTYNRYEIAPYVMGDIYVPVTYEELYDIIPHNSILIK